VAQQPTVTKTADGLYTVELAVSYTDALGVVETVALLGAEVSAWTSDAADDVRGRILTVGGRTITLAVYAGGSLDDHGDSSSELIKVRVVAD
jgi:hypothetical protein